MTTPFGGVKNPIRIPLIESPTVADTSPTPEAITLTSTVTNSTQLGTVLDFSKFSGTFYFGAVWGHDSVGGSTGLHYITLYDYTNTATLAIATSQSSDNLAAFFTATSFFTTFTKPASTAKVGIRLTLSTATLAQNFYIWKAEMWIIP